MGVNIPHVKQIIHIGPSKSIEQYMQQIGRAGRKGQDAHAILYYSNLQTSNRLVELGKITKSMQNYCKNNSTCYRQMLLNYFGFEKKILLENKPRCSIWPCCSICDSE